ncbi:DUF3053 domain-containing protein [Schauerella aestuarii]|uniref:DUF3053 domain-containing protein n=1 Tax=Schauerella aestuarii TaxID=2511204 RepID=UPI00137112B1|nr:DUF3053 domain-containing protein [Achromobacter aestuarii]MYZ41617.1 DUF3053 domain-containing protein [Achromobacter aestuarii]
MKVVSRAWLALFLTVPLLLAACGDKEPEQRAAFSQFLQTRIIDKPGTRVPQPTEEEKKSFGDYASHYAVITDFHAGMNKSVTPLGTALQQGSISSVNDLVARRGDLEKARTTMTEIRTAIEKQQADADAARAKLKQPDDLKKVYDMAYDRTVTQPANGFKTVFPLADASLQRAIETADYVEKNKSKIEINGAIVRVSDPKVQAELNRRLQAMNEQAAGLNKAQADMQKMITGR